MTLRALVFGRTGQVAVELARRAGPAVALRAVGRHEADLRDEGRCAAIIAAADADVIVNAAAYTAVDRAESEPDLAMQVNARTPGAMAVAAAARGLPLVHLSTDYVFDGRLGRPWREDDPTGPLNVYGSSKLAGEAAVQAAGGPHAILRTSWVFAAHGANFVRTMLRLSAERDRLSVVDDQRAGPTWAGHVADAVIAVAAALAAGRGASGVFHFAGAPTASWRDLAEAVFARADWLPAPSIMPVRTEDWPTPAARPIWSALDCARIGEAYGLAQPDWRTGLDAVIAELRETGR